MVENYKTSEPVTLKVVPVSYQDDDINLYDIYCILARYKTIIGGLLILSILAAAAYLFLATPVYKSEVYLVIPSFNDIKTLNLALEGMKDKEKSSLIPEYSQESVLNTFMFNFNSQAIHREFFGKYSKYNGRLDIEFVNNTNNTRVTVHALSQDPVLVVEGLNQYVDFINLKTVNKLKENIESVLEARRDEINREIASKRMTEKKRKEDFIIVLKEALRIAKKAGITTGISRNNYVGEGTGNLQTGLIRAPLYMRGTKVLSEEISALENRKNDDPFIEGLNELELLNRS